MDAKGKENARKGSSQWSVVSFRSNAIAVRSLQSTF